MLQQVNGAEETLHTVIADQARTRSVGELWTTAIGGSMNASLLWFQFPALHWLAAGFAGVAAYGIWGLIDRRIRVLKLANTEHHSAEQSFRVARGLAGAAGWVAAIAAVVGFLAAALGGLSMPGR